MSEFEQMMANIDVPTEIAKQVSDSAESEEIAAVWSKLAPLVDETFGTCSTGAAVCAVGMMVAYVGDQLSEQIMFGESPEDKGEKVHPNFCIMAIALLAVNTLKASRVAWDDKKSGDNDGDEKEGIEKGSKKEGSEAGKAGSNSEAPATDT